MTCCSRSKPPPAPAHERADKHPVILILQRHFAISRGGSPDVFIEACISNIPGAGATKRVARQRRSRGRVSRRAEEPTVTLRVAVPSRLRPARMNSGNARCARRALKRKWCCRITPHRRGACRSACGRRRWPYGPRSRGVPYAGTWPRGRRRCRTVWRRACPYVAVWRASAGLPG